MSREGKKANGEDCAGLISNLPLQISIKKGDQPAAVQCNLPKKSVHPPDRTPIKNWHPPLPLWKCNWCGTRNGKKRYTCNNFVTDEKGLRVGIGKCVRCRQYYIRDKKKHWQNRMVVCARISDRKRLRQGKFTTIDWDRFITKDHMQQVYDACRKRCWWCGIWVRKFDRKHQEGLTVDRLTNGPHYLRECAIACFRCNRQSWRKGFEHKPWWARESLAESPEFVFGQWLNTYHAYRDVLAGIEQATRFGYVENGRCPDIS